MRLAMILDLFQHHHVPKAPKTTNAVTPTPIPIPAPGDKTLCPVDEGLEVWVVVGINEFDTVNETIDDEGKTLDTTLLVELAALEDNVLSVLAELADDGKAITEKTDDCAKTPVKLEYKVQFIWYWSL
jgi:hypothetical protein